MSFSSWMIDCPWLLSTTGQTLRALQAPTGDSLLWIRLALSNPPGSVTLTTDWPLFCSCVEPECCRNKPSWRSVAQTRVSKECSSTVSHKSVLSQECPNIDMAAAVCDEQGTWDECFGTITQELEHWSPRAHQPGALRGERHMLFMRQALVRLFSFNGPGSGYGARGFANLWNTVP